MVHPGRPPTTFERHVYALTAAIPPGRVSTYATLAAVMGKGGAARAVGQALRRNPYAPTVPCHRVVAAGGRLGGFSGQWGEATPNVQRKAALLVGEGVAVAAGACGRGALLTPAELEAAARTAVPPPCLAE